MGMALKQRLLRSVFDETAEVFTDAVAPQTAFPFKAVQMEGPLSDTPLYNERDQICNMGFLPTINKREDASLGYRCPAEPVVDYVRKGGLVEDTEGRTCLCNNLAATAGF